MTNKILKEKEAEKFIEWLNLIKNFLPKTMTLSQAREIFLRKQQDEKNEKIN